MTRIDDILNNTLYKSYMADIEQAEVQRKFCLHGLNHSLDVARISHIINLEEGLGFEKDIVYAMALLHDIGRGVEYKDGTPHHEAGIEISRNILQETGFDSADTDMILSAIFSHKTACQEKSSLGYLLFKADKLSRNCFTCKAYDECYWKEELKNKTITY